MQPAWCTDVYDRRVARTRSTQPPPCAGRLLASSPHPCPSEPRARPASGWLQRSPPRPSQAVQETSVPGAARNGGVNVDGHVSGIPDRSVRPVSPSPRLPSLHLSVWHGLNSSLPARTDPAQTNCPGLAPTPPPLPQPPPHCRRHIDAASATPLPVAPTPVLRVFPLSQGGSLCG